ncbi:MAG: ABC transporter ATP-binding protein [Deltaproteobacteria bacterium]|nr:ABC transporter ATP-binding protein [Deltaproteobacteria bacterium]
MTAPRTAVMSQQGTSLVVSALSARRGAVQLFDVSFEIKPLELHGVLAPRGAGKTLLLEAVAGLAPSYGDVLLGGVPLDAEERRHHVFYVPDEIAFASERARDVLALARRSLGIDASVVERVLADLALGEALHQRVRELSPSAQKRLLVALGLLVPRGFVFIDEPLAGLDAKEQRSLIRVLRLSTNERRAVLCATANATDAERTFDRFTILAHGRVAATGALHELRARTKVQVGAPLEEVVHALT